MVDQLLSPILDLIIGVKQMNMFLDDPLGILTPTISYLRVSSIEEDSITLVQV